MNFSGSKSAFVILVVCVIVSGINYCDGSPNEKRLLHHLIDTYNPLERPVFNDSKTLDVRLGLTLMRIVSVNELESNVETLAWLHLEWRDENLVWNQSEFGNISDIRIPPHRVWIPDIYFYNHVGEILDSTNPTKLVIKSDGNVSYIPPGTFKTACEINTYDYPFEELKCPMKIGSWTYNSNDMDLKSDQLETGGDISSFTKHSEWELKGFPVQRNVIYYACCPEAYVDITFTLQIRRRGDHILFLANSINFVVSSIIILSALLPPSSGQKMTFGMFAILLAMWSTMLFNPKSIGTDSPPRLVMYFAGLFLVAFTSMVVNVGTFTLFHRKGTMPGMMKSIVLNKVLKVLKPICPIRREVDQGTEMYEEHRERASSVTATNTLGSDIQELISRVDDLKNSRQERLEGVMNDWEYLAIVIDRFFFYFWTIFVIIFASACFPSYNS